MITDTEPIEDFKGGAEGVQKEALKTVHENSPVVGLAARLGYAAKGMIYILLGLMAFRAALGIGSADLDTRDALMTIFLQPFGGFLLLATAVGLAGYIFWRALQALLDTERVGSGARGIVKRLAYSASGLGYLGLMYLAVRLLLGMGANPENNAAEHWTGQILALPILGPWVVGIAGAGVFALGLYQYFLGFSRLWKRKFKLDSMSKAAKAWVFFAGPLGIASRGIVYNVIGVFLVRAALDMDPQKAGGLGDALVGIAGSPFSPWLLGMVAAGMMLYGLYSLLAARFYELSIEKDELREELREEPEPNT